MKYDPSAEWLFSLKTFDLKQTYDQTSHAAKQTNLDRRQTTTPTVFEIWSCK